MHLEIKVVGDYVAPLARPVSNLLVGYLVDSECFAHNKLVLVLCDLIQVNDRQERLYLHFLSAILKH